MAQFVSIIEAARMCDVHYNTIRNWLREGRISSKRPKKAVMVNVEELKPFMPCKAHPHEVTQ